MRAVVVEEFGRIPEVRAVPDPVPEADGVVVRVEATGLCRSDWHGWMGHDDGIVLPHVPGHELAGRVEEVGSAVSGWRVGDRVTVPFVCACGSCASCAAGDQQVCERQEQPGFTHWGSFAEYVALRHADTNLVALPDGMTYETAAGLGCRFATAYRAVVVQGRVRAGEWVVVHGCGGVGLSAVMIAAASGALVVAVDVAPHALELARQFGAVACVDASDGSAHRAGGPAEAVREVTGGGAHVSLDALGSPATCAASVASLRRRGRHVQVGLLPSAGGEGPVPRPGGGKAPEGRASGAQGVPASAPAGTAVPMDRVIAYELEILGSHGMAAHAYPEMLAQIAAGRLRPDLLVTGRIGLDEVPASLAAMGAAPQPPSASRRSSVSPSPSASRLPSAPQPASASAPQPVPVPDGQERWSARGGITIISPQNQAKGRGVL